MSRFKVFFFFLKQDNQACLKKIWDGTQAFPFKVFFLRQNKTRNKRGEPAFLTPKRHDQLCQEKIWDGTETCLILSLFETRQTLFVISKISRRKARYFLVSDFPNLVKKQNYGRQCLVEENNKIFYFIHFSEDWRFHPLRFYFPCQVQLQFHLPMYSVYQSKTKISKIGDISFQVAVKAV